MPQEFISDVEMDKLVQQKQATAPSFIPDVEAARYFGADGFSPVSSPVAQEKGLLEKAQGITGGASQFLAEELTGIGLEGGKPRERGFFGSIFQETLGAKGVAGIAQQPARALYTQMASGVSRDLSSSLGDLAQVTTQLTEKVKELPADDPRRQALYAQIANNQQIMDEAGTANQELMNTFLQPSEVISTAMRGGLVLAGRPVTQPVSLAGFNEFVKTAVPRMIQTGTQFGVFQAAKGVEMEKEPPDVMKDFAKGFAFGSILSGLAATGKAIVVKGVPKLLSIVSSVPDEAIQRAVQDQTGQVKAGTELAVKTKGRGVLDYVRQKTLTLRQKLSKQYQEGLVFLTEQFKGERMGLTSPDIKTITKINSQYGVRQLPQNMHKMSVKESLELYKYLNELKNIKEVREGAAGAYVREFLKNYRGQLVNNFGGSGGATDAFLRNYSTKFDVYINANDIVKPFGTKPIQSATALNRLKLAYGDSKGAYLDALHELEQEVGGSLLDYVAGLQFEKAAPKRIGDFGLGEIIRYLLLPLSSPRAVGAESRAIGAATRFLGGTAAGQTTEAVVGLGAAAARPQRIFGE